MNIAVDHQSVNIHTTFEKFTEGIESAVGRFDPAVLDQVTTDPKAAENGILGMQGAEDLMLFSIEDHGLVLQMKSLVKKAKQYRIGNPLIAMSMTSLDLRAGLYVPLSLIVYETFEGQVFADYDLPSSLLGPLGNESITTTAVSLDQKLRNLIIKAENDNY